MPYNCPAGECSDGLSRPCDHHRWSAERLRRWREGKSIARRTARDEPVLLLADDDDDGAEGYSIDAGVVGYVNARQNIHAAAQQRGAAGAEARRIAQAVLDQQPQRGPRVVVNTAWGSILV